MTPRDQYAAAAIAGLASQVVQCEDGQQVPAWTNEAIATNAIDIAEKMAALACHRWGHLYQTSGESCDRCGRKRGAQ